MVWEYSPASRLISISGDELIVFSLLYEARNTNERTGLER